MKIQIHSSINNMSTTGKQVLGDMQDFSTPLVDLMVRESIQNSTDASKPIATGDDTVSVSYDVKSIANGGVNELFEQISDKLSARFPIDEQSDCLVIRDFGTVGLTGCLRKRDVPVGDKLGNLIKLIYDIRKPQENSAAGGAWGLGKTVYYKLGIGIVLYYTRILQDGEYVSRLAACMVENEDDSQALLPVCPNEDDLRPSGIAWWGAADGDAFNRTIPITDEAEIQRILQLFGVSPYDGVETGTTIVIPYLNTDKLMDTTRYTSNKNEGDTNINHSVPVTTERTWLSTLSRFLWVAVQRWYYPRLDNKCYVEATGLRSLRLSINGEVKTKRDMHEVFRHMQSLYNHSILNNASNDFGKERIKVNTYVQGYAGHVSYAKFTPEKLKMVDPWSQASPFLFFDLDDIGMAGCAIIAYTRKPGMVVWYDVVKGLSNESEYVLGHFSLQSDSPVVDKDGNILKSLDDYVRGFEAANHRCWNRDDYNITENIKRNVSKKILAAYRPTIAIKDDGPQDTGLGRLLSAFMPPTGFGNRPTPSDNHGGGRGGNRTLHKRPGFRVEQVGAPEYSSHAVTLKYVAKISANCSPSFEMELSIATEDKVISFEDLSSQMHMEPPIEMTSVLVTAPETFMIDVCNHHHVGTYINAALSDVDGVANKVKFSIKNTESMELSFSITLEYSSLEMKPVISVN